MAVGSIAMWLVVPVAWLWVGSHMTKSSQPTIGPYLLVLAGTIVSMFALGSSDMAESAKKLMALVAQAVQKLPNKISITGHADRLRMHCLLAYVNVRPTKTGASFTWKGARSALVMRGWLRC